MGAFNQEFATADFPTPPFDHVLWRPVNRINTNEPLINPKDQPLCTFVMFEGRTILVVQKQEKVQPEGQTQPVQHEVTITLAAIEGEILPPQARQTVRVVIEPDEKHILNIIRLKRGTQAQLSSTQDSFKRTIVELPKGCKSLPEKDISADLLLRADASLVINPLSVYSTAILPAGDFLKPWPPPAMEDPKVLDPYEPYTELPAEIVRGRYRIAGATHRGRNKSRPINEDSISLPEKSDEAPAGQMPILILADGAGAHPAGEEASAIAVKNTPSHVREQLTKVDDTASALQEGVKDSNRDIFEKFNGLSLTTIVAAVLGKNFAYVVNVGDSRLSRFRNNNLEHITQDDSDPDHPNILKKVLGQSGSRLTDIHTNLVSVQSGDLLLLDSDGLHRYVEDEEIVRVLKEAKSPSEAVKTLIDLALRKGGRDNISVIVVAVGDEPDIPSHSGS